MYSRCPSAVHPQRRSLAPGTTSPGEVVGNFERRGSGRGAQPVARPPDASVAELALQLTLPTRPSTLPTRPLEIANNTLEQLRLTTPKAVQEGAGDAHFL